MNLWSSLLKSWHMFVSPGRCLFSYLNLRRKYFWMKFSKPLSLSEIRLTLNMHAPSKAWLPLILYNLWSHFLPLHLLTSFEIWSPMGCTRRFLLPTRSRGITPFKLWILLRWYLVESPASPLVDPSSPPHYMPYNFIPFSSYKLSWDHVGLFMVTATIMGRPFYLYW